MTPMEFISIVAEMRRAQKEYYRTRSQSALTESKRRERAVDKELAELFAGKQQGNLFSEES